MKTVNLDDLDLLAFGNTITQWGVVFEGGGESYVVPFPGEGPAMTEPVNLLELTLDEWTRVIRQTDTVEVIGPNKVLLRKGQRLIDSHISWAVWRRDGFRCRYCGKEAPLTVDHVDLWEDGGATVPQNLISACKPCNKTRGNLPYGEWLESAAYLQRVKGVSEFFRNMNAEIARTLPALMAMRVTRQRSR